MAFEAGIGALRANFVRETTVGTTPTNPAWLRFSDELDSAGGWSPNTNIAARTAIGSPDVQGFSIGAEDHELSVAYRLQRWLTTATEQPSDAIADGLLRDSNGYLPNTHSVLLRQVLTGESAAGSGKDKHVYTYGTGGKFSSASLSGDPSDSEPVLVEGTYVFEKVRSYTVSQPASATTMKVVSSSTSDTGGPTVTIERDGVATSETLTLNGTTVVTGSTSFADIGSVRLSAACVGDVTVTFTTGGATCTVILGSTSNGGIEGDLGLPLLGSGSYESALSSAFFHILGDTITKGGSAIDTNVMTLAMNVENNIQADAVTRQKSKVLNEGMRTLTATATVFSASGSHDAAVDHLKATAGDIVWTFGSGQTVTMSGAVLTGPGARVYTKGSATMQRDNTLTATDLTIAP